ncbi:MAG: hypothetical protein EXR54_07485 [Dehalococcoidia bacterium]|nr:hypothetical protein [Dehalococcoidia bacterium]
MSSFQPRERKPLRLKGYDYTQPEAYFVTVCAMNREYLFGEVTGGEMRVNEAGRMVEHWWLELENKFPCISRLLKNPDFVKNGRTLRYEN